MKMINNWIKFNENKSEKVTVDMLKDINFAWNSSVGGSKILDICQTIQKKALELSIDSSVFFNHEDWESVEELNDCLQQSVDFIETQEEFKKTIISVYERLEEKLLNKVPTSREIEEVCVDIIDEDWHIEYAIDNIEMTITFQKEVTLENFSRAISKFERVKKRIANIKNNTIRIEHALFYEEEVSEFLLLVDIPQ